MRSYLGEPAVESRLGGLCHGGLRGRGHAGGGRRKWFLCRPGGPTLRIGHSADALTAAAVANTRRDVLGGVRNTRRRIQTVVAGVWQSCPRNARRTLAMCRKTFV